MPYLGHSPTQAGSYIEVDDFGSSFNGNNVAFTLQVGGVNITPNQQNLLVMIDGVLQQPSNAFSVSGSTITFTEAPVSGADLYCLLMGQSASVGQGTIGADELKISGDGTSGQLLKSDGDGTYSYLNQTSVTSGTATTLATARTINGVSFDGSANITITADANTLSNTTLKSTVVNSSLTSVGTLAGLSISDNTTISGDNKSLDVRSADYSNVYIGSAGSSGAGLDRGLIVLRENGNNKTLLYGDGTAEFAGTIALGDLDIIPTSSNVSVIKHDSGSGSLTLQGDQVNIKNRAGNETGLSYNDGGGVTFAGAVTIQGTTTKLSSSGAQLWVGENDGSTDIYMSKGSGEEIRFSKNSTGNLDIISNNGIIHLNETGYAFIKTNGVGTSDAAARTLILGGRPSDSNYVTLGFDSNKTYRGSWDFTANTGKMAYWVYDSSWKEILGMNKQGYAVLGGGDRQYNWGDERRSLSIKSVDNAGANNYAVLEMVGHSINNDGALGAIHFYDHTSSNASIQVNRQNNNGSAKMMFSTSESGGNKKTRMTIYDSGPVQFRDGISFLATNGNAATGDEHYDVAIKIGIYRKSCDSTDISQGYIDIDHDIYRDNVLGVEAGIFDSNLNVFKPGFANGDGWLREMSVFASGGAIRCYFGGSVAIGDIVKLVIFYTGNTG